MGLIEFLFSNPLFIIIGLALINFLFSRGKQEEAKETREKKTMPQPQHRPQPKRRPRQVEHVPHPQVEEIQSKSIEQLRDEQLARLTHQYQSQSSVELEDEVEKVTTHKSTNTISKEKYKKSELQKGLKGRLAKEGLIESVIMAEVLGPPRALNPYKNDRFRRKSN